MNIPLNWRSQLEGLPGGTWLVQSLVAIVAAIGARWDAQHADDGGHTTITIGSLTGPQLRSGTGSPEGVVSAPRGSLYLRTDGGAATTLYVKETTALLTGWTAK